MCIDKIFTTEELQQKTRELYYSIGNSLLNFEEEFSRIFELPFRVVFGNTNREEVLFLLLQNYYRNEYFIKKSFKNKELLNLPSTFEFPILNSRADIVSVKTSLTCYEIKTEYDTLSRLQKQIDDYSALFEYIYVICPADRASSVKKVIPQHCGLITYSSRRNSGFKTIIRASKSPFLNKEIILSCWRCTELKQYYGTDERKVIAKTKSLEEILSASRDCFTKRFS